MSILNSDKLIAIDDGVILQSRLQKYYESDQCQEAREALQQLVDNPEYNTNSAYYGGDGITFIQRHLQYLSTHPVKSIAGYISNLKLMTRVSRAR